MSLARCPLAHLDEQIAQIGIGLDAVHLAGSDQAGEAGPIPVALVMTREERIAAVHGRAADGVFDEVGVTQAPETPFEAAQELPSEIQAALDGPDGAQLVVLALDDSFSATSVSVKKSDLIGVISGYTKPIHAANATVNKGAYAARAILDPKNAAYKQKAKILRKIIPAL
jgi:hypothetical protein